MKPFEIPLKEKYQTVLCCFFVHWQEVFSDYDGVLWADSSIKFRASDIKWNKDDLESSAGLALLEETGASNYAVTFRQMYDFIPTDINKQSNVSMFAASVMLLYKTAIGYEKVMRWAFLCALTESCIAPRGHTRWCKFGKNRYTQFAHCNRYDQSVMNLLLTNWLDFDEKKFGPLRLQKKNTGMFQNERGTVGDITHIKWCIQRRRY